MFKRIANKILGTDIVLFFFIGELIIVSIIYYKAMTTLEKEMKKILDNDKNN